MYFGVGLRQANENEPAGRVHIFFPRMSITNMIEVAGKETMSLRLIQVIPFVAQLAGFAHDCFCRAGLETVPASIKLTGRIFIPVRGKLFLIQRRNKVTALFLGKVERSG